MKVNIVVTVPDGTVDIHGYIDEALDAAMAWSFAPRSEVDITQDQLDELASLRKRVEGYQNELTRSRHIESAAAEVIETMRWVSALRRLEQILLEE